jgi:polar amino acid transport system substrate-binding protein
MKHFVRLAMPVVLAAALVVSLATTMTTATASVTPKAVPKVTTPAGCAAVQTSNPKVVGKSYPIGTDPEAPPFEDINTSGKLVGFDIDLIKEVMACLGASYTLDQIKFAGLIPALQAKHIDAVISSIVATPPRLQVVNFVGYLRQQEGFLVPKGNPDHLTTIDDLCGHSVSVFPGSLELVFVNSESSKCVAAGKKPVTAVIFDNFIGTVQGVVDHRADASILPPPYGIEGMAAFPGKLQMTPVIPAFNSTVGIAVPKTSKALENAFYSALKVIQASGDEKVLMKKWKLTSNLFSPTKKLS